MDFMRQRLLQAVVPVVAFAVTVPLAAAGWASGGSSSAPVRATSRASWPLSRYRPTPWPFATAAPPRDATSLLRAIFADLVALLVVHRASPRLRLDRGLAAAGFVTLALTLSRYTDRADPIVTTTIYPAICAVRDRGLATLQELFVKSNRADDDVGAAFLRGLPSCSRPTS